MVTGDSRAFNWGAGTFASRGIVTSGHAIHAAALEVRAKALRLAADLLEASPTDLEIAQGVVRVKGVPGQALTLGALAAMANPIRYAYGKEATETALRLVKPRAGAVLAPGEAPGLEASGYHAPSQATFASGCHAAIVEVDVETGAVQLLRYAVQHDCGTMVNPTIVEGQIRGGVAQGIGGALYEKLILDGDGQPLTASYMDFLLPTAVEIPSIEIGHLETPSPLNPLGIKGVGEAGAIPGPALLAEAIDDALAPLGIRIREMPLSPTRLRELIRAAAGGAAHAPSRRPATTVGLTARPGAPAHPEWPHAAPWPFAPCFVGRGTSSAGLRSKKPTGFSMKPMQATGMTGQSSGPHHVVGAERVPDHQVGVVEGRVVLHVARQPGPARMLVRIVASRVPLARIEARHPEMLGHEAGALDHLRLGRREGQDVLAGHQLVADGLAQPVLHRRIDDLPEAPGQRVDDPLGLGLAAQQGGSRAKGGRRRDSAGPGGSATVSTS